MLALTENATTIVKQVVGGPEADDAAGLRITGTPETQLAVTAVAGSEPNDLIVNQDGATIYLDSGAAQALDDKVLDAGVDDSGNVQFGLYQQP